MSQRPVTAVIVGAGHRSMCYAEYSKARPDAFQIVGVADPLEYRRKQVAAEYNLPPERLFNTAEDLARAGKIADAVINGTMDHHHVSTSLPLLEAGYDILLEKPFATSEEEMWTLAKAARRLGRKVMVCHVLRYAPFYAAIKAKVLAGEIGELMNIQTTEHVSYHHMATGFVRGKWNRRDLCHSTMLMAKCCHDMDLIAWMMSGTPVKSVASFGGRMFFRPEKAPKGAGTRCLVDCPIEPDCEYSAGKMYIDHPIRWGAYVWAELEHLGETTVEQKIASLKGSNPHGRCVWKCDNDVVDHQTVLVEFDGGCVASHNMVGGVARPSRSIHLLGTRGEIQGVLEDSRFVIRHADPRPKCETSEQVVDLNVGGDTTGAFGGHGGGDERLVADFVHFVRGEERSISCTSLDDSVQGHLIGFLADKSREQGRVVAAPRL